MKIIDNIEFESLFQNEEFIRLLKEDAPQAGELVEDLCRKNPDKEESIRLVVQLLLNYNSEQQDVGRDKTTIMWNNIISKSKVIETVRVFHLAPVWRIAASVAILVLLALYFFEYSNDNSIRKFADRKIEAIEDSRIIISDGSEYKLKSNDLLIKYESDGKEIIIEEKNKLTVKVNNQTKDAKVIYNQLVVPFGRRQSLVLSDGTVVQLNSGSTLVFPAKFSDSKRKVYMKGEGYFEVAKDASKPFIVSTEFINVKVLGTHFNISAYKNEKSVSAVLVEGSVEVFSNIFFNNKHYKIKPGQGCFFIDNASGLKIQNVDVNEYVSWKDGYFLIKDQSLGNITKKIERYYNKRIVFNGNELADRILSGKLILGARLEETLDFLAMTTKSRYILNDDGTYVFVK